MTEKSIVVGVDASEGELVARPGTAAETIEAEAVHWPADLIVVGSHGKT